MAEIRLLKEKLKSLVKQAEIDVNQYACSVGNGNSKPRTNLLGAQSQRSMWALDIFLASTKRKVLQMKLKLQMMNGQRISARKEAERLHQYECLLNLICQEHAKLFGRTVFKVLGVELFDFYQIDNFFNQFL